jgi:hypothetical protein
MKLRFPARLADDSGVMSVVVAVVMVMLLSTAAVALDIAHMLEVKNELQRVADAAAMAGARGLWPNTLPVVASTPLPDCATGLNRATAVALNSVNKVDGSSLPAEAVNVQIGRYDLATRTFTPGCSANSDAAKATVRKDGVNMLFARVFGQGPVSLSATATAIMGPAGGIGKGGLPIALNKRFVIPNNYIFINFSPDNTDNAGWFSDLPNANAQTFKDYINNGTCPPLRVGDIIYLQNGQDTTALGALQSKLNEHGGQWDTFLPVVDTEKFNTAEPIVAFAPFRITAVRDSTNSKGVGGTVLGLAEAANGEPGGQNLGLLSSTKAVN